MMQSDRAHEGRRKRKAAEGGGRKEENDSRGLSVVVFLTGSLL